MLLNKKTNLIFISLKLNDNNHKLNQNILSLESKEKCTYLYARVGSFFLSIPMLYTLTIFLMYVYSYVYSSGLNSIV